MSRGRVPFMDLKRVYDVEQACSMPNTFQDDDDDGDDLWPLGEIDPKKLKFPCCIVWTPLPVVSWLAPFIGHVGLCREDGVILDFAGSNFISVDDFAFGPPARYLQLDRKQVSLLHLPVNVSLVMFVLEQLCVCFVCSVACHRTWVGTLASTGTNTQSLERRLHGTMR